MERMKHTGDYELDRINMLEQECADLEEENKELYNKLMGVCDRVYELQEENKKLKENIAWYEKEEDRLREENKKLREELSAYDREYFDEDKKAKNIFTEEGALQ